MKRQVCLKPCKVRGGRAACCGEVGNAVPSCQAGPAQAVSPKASSYEELLLAVFVWKY